MLINLLDAYDYLLVVLILLPGSNQRSLNTDHLRRKNETAEEGPKSFSLLKEIDNFVDGQCPPSANSLNINGINGQCKYDCSSDIDCTEDYKCCEDGCSFVCMEPWFPNRVVDWAKPSSLNQISELPDQKNGPWKSRGEPCSTSVLDGLQPLRCPTNYVCQITVDGDIQLNVPNRGECTSINDKKTSIGITENTNNPDFSTQDSVCSHKEESYKHKEKFRKDCNICVCHNGVVFCDNRPCPVQIGIPAGVSSYEEHRQTSRHRFISIDSEIGDTEDASGSSASADGDKGHDERPRNDDAIVELSSGDGDTGGTGEEHSGHGDSVPGVGVISGDGDQAQLREVNSRENEDVNSRDDQTQQEEVDNRDNSNSNTTVEGKLNNQELGWESGLAELETEASTTTETHKSEISTSTWETSTLRSEISTLVPKTSTLASEISSLASQTSTLVPELSTLPSEIVQGDSSRLKTIEPTEDIIRLGGSNYEYGSSSGSGSGEENSTEETKQPEPVYLGTIVLDKYIRGSDQDEGSGFETVNDGSLDRETEEKSGDEVSSSGSIVGGKYLRKSKTSEYLATTDDEH